ncbi:cache domain-containing protein [Azospirillum sp. A1-3]|uniref:cache domain-containing protein n=1 Tax=Azospirillum sp. A1-3 TaxID=185874 RepID=UPI0020775B85|nr:cache domain-containing protein [Azospirillum sp. A1-3]MCM8738567.1 cache domain-containing protein [Azospirillum sp. A1-3]
MKKMLSPLIISVFAVISQAAFAGTPEQAREMAEKAAEYLQKNGEEKAFSAINDKSGPFHDGDVYVFVHDTTGLVKAHGGFPNYIGKNTVGATDLDGKTFVKDITQVKDTGWIDYKWQDPQTKAVAEKTVYVKRVNDLLICAGAYKK